MLISTKGRYALRVMIDLAEHRGQGFIPMKDIAARQELSLKYLERILPTLTRGKYVEGQHGKGGGYRLMKAPEDCRVGDILRLTEGTLAPVACLEEGAAPCQRSAECRTIGMWQKLDRMISEYLDGITVADLAQGDPADEYMI